MNINIFKRHKNKSQDEGYKNQPEDTISLLSMIVVLVFVFIFLLTGPFSLKKLIKKEGIFRQNTKSCTEAKDVDACQKTSLVGLECAWYSNCSKCAQRGSSNEVTCQITSSTKDTKPNPTEKQVEINCSNSATLNDCNLVNTKGGNCAWYADCSRCAKRGTQTKDACMIVPSTSPNQTTQTTTTPSKATLINNVADCGINDGNLEKCTLSKAENKRCVWYACGSKCRAEGTDTELVCGKKTKQ